MIGTAVSPGFADLAALRSTWDRLFLARPHEPSVSFEWTSAMVRHHLRPADRGFLLRLHRNGATVGLVPLVARSVTMARQRVTVLAPLSEENNTHSDLLLQTVDADIMQALVAALFELDVKWDCFRLARLLEGSPVADALGQALAADHRLHNMRGGLPAYVLPLPTTFDAYLAARSAKFRNHLKRVERRLLGAGAVALHQVCDVDEFDTAYHALIAIERASWKQVHGTSIASTQRQAGFYHDFGLAALGTGRLHLQWLTLDARPIAYNLGCVTEGGYHYLKTSYDSAFRSLSPATYLRARLVAGLISRGVSRLDFPGEPYEWERQWTDVVRWRVGCTLYPATMRGRTLAALDRVRHVFDRPGTVEHADARAM